jgi:hypothetical protein
VSTPGAAPHLLPIQNPRATLSVPPPDARAAPASRHAVRTRKPRGLCALIAQTFCSRARTCARDMFEPAAGVSRVVLALLRTYRNTHAACATQPTRIVSTRVERKTNTSKYTLQYSNGVTSEGTESAAAAHKT